MKVKTDYKEVRIKVEESERFVELGKLVEKGFAWMDRYEDPYYVYKVQKVIKKIKKNKK